jgi:hypothetical protein
MCHLPCRDGPAGFSLENFDATGEWRTKDKGGRSILRASWLMGQELTALWHFGKHC